MVRAVQLTRRLVLEERGNVPDGHGGVFPNWQPLGAVWAEVDARTGREAQIGNRDTASVRYRIVVRGAPVGAASRPKPNQRFREGARVFNIQAVAEHDPRGRWLECWAEEGRA